ncbi:flagellar hook-length control protein FliK [Rhodovulum iodosum]|nr:flagellar hook-length control protein FliK [Rhodovulum robiginosum]
MAGVAVEKAAVAGGAESPAAAADLEAPETEAAGSPQGAGHAAVPMALAVPAPVAHSANMAGPAGKAAWFPSARTSQPGNGPAVPMPTAPSPGPGGPNPAPPQAAGKPGETETDTAKSGPFRPASPAPAALPVGAAADIAALPAMAAAPGALSTRALGDAAFRPRPSGPGQAPGGAASHQAGPAVTDRPSAPETQAGRIPAGRGPAPCDGLPKPSADGCVAAPLGRAGGGDPRSEGAGPAGKSGATGSHAVGISAGAAGSAAAPPEAAGLAPEAETGPRAEIALASRAAPSPGGPPDGTAPPTARRPAAAPQVQIVEALRHARDGGVELQLRPEELGRVRIALSPADTGLTVTVQAERAETDALLRRHIEHLGAELRGLGYGEIRFEFGAGQGDDARPPPDGPVPERAEEEAAGSPGAADPAAPPARTGLDIRI